VAHQFLHKYRFDTVFDANRLGSILQYIQGGLHTTTLMDNNKNMEDNDNYKSAIVNLGIDPPDAA